MGLNRKFDIELIEDDRIIQNLSNKRHNNHKITIMVRIYPIGDNLQVGTRAHWDAKTQNLYYVDVPTSTIYRHKPSTGKITKATVGDEPLAFAFPVEGHDDKFIAGLGRNLVVIRWDGVTDSVCTCHHVAEVDKNVDLTDNRLNGGKIDPYGRLWAGTMGPEAENGQVTPGKGALYSLTNGKLTRHVEDIGISNGIAFDTNLNKMYYIDTLFPGIFQFDYDGENGEIENRCIIFRFGDHGIEGSPDGLTIDQDGNLWVAMIHGSAIVKIDPRKGSLLKKIQMPTPQITSLTWGDKHLDRLYVTTAKMEIDGEIPADPAGCTFKLRHLAGVKGFAGDRYKL